MKVSSVIKVSSVSKSVKTEAEVVTILQDVSLEIELGERIAIIGVSGAGKSTLMSLLAGLDCPSSGDVYLFDHCISDWDDDQRAQLRAQSVGFVFQQFLLVPSLSALENVLLPLLIQQKPENTQRALQLLEQVGLKDRAHHLPNQLSGGEQQRVALARAFMIQPQVLFADEPTGNLDQQTASTVIELLFALNEQYGTTLVLVTHDETLASRCDRVLVLNQGRVVVQ